MKLPENYQNWIEFAKECDKILQKNPHIDTVKIGYTYPIHEFRIDAVKAKAFDEVMELAHFSMDDVRHLRDSIYRGFSTEKAEFIFNLLVKLCQK